MANNDLINIGGYELKISKAIENYASKRGLEYIYLDDESPIWFVDGSTKRIQLSFYYSEGGLKLCLIPDYIPLKEHYILESKIKEIRFIDLISGNLCDILHQELDKIWNSF